MEKDNKIEKRIAIINIILETLESFDQFNEIVYTITDCITSTMGSTHKEQNIRIICLVVDAPVQLISTVSSKISALEGITVQTTYSKPYYV